MKTVFDAATRNELETRIHSLTAQSQALWGKMNVAQMLKHCALCDDMFFGTLTIKRVFIGRLIGPMVLRKILSGKVAIRKNSPTSPSLTSTISSEETEQQKKQWLSSLSRYEHYTHSGFIHPFFGRMTVEQVGQLAYQHADHHLRQFGV